METLGMKKFWKPPVDAAAPEQILRVSGYITVALQAVHCNRRSKIWASVFEGSDSVAITSRLTYRREETTLESSVLHGMTQIRSETGHAMTTPRTIALKVPTDADALELSVEISAVKDDSQRSILDVLNTPEFQRAFELTPTVIGEIGSTTTFVKRCLSDMKPVKSLVVSFPGIISIDSATDPAGNDSLMKGRLILISTQDDGDNILDRASADKITVEGNTLLFKGKEVRNTYIIFNISMDAYRGYTITAPWYTLFQESLTTLNDLILTRDEVERESRYQTAIKLWLDAGALLQNDLSYLQAERDKIKQDYLDQLITKFHRVHRSVAVGSEGRSILDVPMNMGRRINDVTVAYHVPTNLSQIIDFRNLRLEDLQRSARVYRDMVKRLN